MTLNVLNTLSTSLARISQTFFTKHPARHWNIFPKGAVVLSGSLFLTSNTEIHENDPIVNDWVKVTNGNFNGLHIMGYNDIRKVRMDVIVNTRPTSIILSSKPYLPVENFKKNIKFCPKKSCLQRSGTMGFCNVIANACTQDVEDILHEAYVTVEAIQI